MLKAAAGSSLKVKDIAGGCSDVRKIVPTAGVVNFAKPLSGAPLGFRKMRLRKFVARWMDAFNGR
jgi:hypothetical protein